MSLPQNTSDVDVETGLLSSQYDPGANAGAGATHRLTASDVSSSDEVTCTPSDQQGQLPLEEKNNDPPPQETFISEETPCRRIKTLSTIGQAILDVCITITSVYFIAFAIMSIMHNGVPATSSLATNLLAAARFGPTIWPILFTTIISRFLMSIAAFRLERGIDIASVEYLLGSRTLFGTISTPFRLRILHYALPLLVTLWVFSPLGGQASLRVISSSPVYTNTTIDIAYLESLSPNRMGGGAGSSDGATYGPSIDAIFINALIGPKTSKDAPQDIYGNLKIPLLEDFAVQSRQADADGWYLTDIGHPLNYSALVGLPTTGIAKTGKTFLSIESSYLYPECSLSLQPIDSWDVYGAFRLENCNNGGGYMAIDLDLDKGPNDYSARHPLTEIKPRRLMFSSAGSGSGQDSMSETKATCTLTTTYVETRFICDGGTCKSTRTRKSRLAHSTTAVTFLDGLQADNHEGTGTTDTAFCSMFINATGEVHPADGSPIERYFVDTNAPFSRPDSSAAVIATIGDRAFSQRLGQLLNTYWLAMVAPFSMTGNFSALDESLAFGMDNIGLGMARHTTAQVETMEQQLLCNTVWVTVLLVGSIVMFVAGVVTTALNLIRKGPEVLDSFTSMMRDSPYAQEWTGPSTEDDSDKARRLQKTRVILGDVRPMEIIGHVALATEIGGSENQRLTSDRMYS